MTILPLVDCEIVDTNVTDNTAVFNNNIQQNYPLGTRYQENNNIYENMGADIVVSTYSAEGIYTVGQIIYKDSKVSKCTATSGEFVKQPEEYTAVDTSFDDSVWDDRYMKIANVTADLPIDGKNVELPVSFRCISFNSDKTKMYTALDSSSEELREYTLAVAGDIGTATYTQSKTLSGYGNILKIFFAPTGLKMYVLSQNVSRKLVQYNLATAWDISTATFVAYKDMPYLQINTFTISSNGTKIYYGRGDDYNTIYTATFSTAWSISTIGSPTTSVSYVHGITDISFSSDGLKLYISGGTYGGGTFNKEIVQYNLSTAWVAAATPFYGGIDFQIDSLYQIESFYLSSDGGQLFFGGNISNNKILYRGVLLTAGDITTAHYTPFPIIHTETRDAIVYEYSITKSDTTYTFQSKKAGVSNSQTLTVFIELNYSSVEEKAYTGSNGTWLAKTLIIRPDAIYIRTSVDKSIEYKTLTSYQFSIVTSPTELTGFSFYEKTNPYKPFDNKSYTVATIDNTMTYKIKALGKMDAVVLAHIKGDLVTVKFYDSTNTLQSEIIDYTLDGSIDSRDEHEHGYTTEIFYNMVNDVRTTIDTGGYIEITLTDTNLELGTLSPCLSIDAGFLDLEMELSITDHSPYEVGIGGVVDYVDGIATINANLTFYEKTVKIDKSVRRMIALKRQVVAIDGGSSFNRPSDAGIALFDSTKLLGRMDKTVVKTINKNNNIDKYLKITTNILEVS